MTENDPSLGEKMILRNQRYIMLALCCLLQNQGGMATGYHANNLTKRVRDMERYFDWIASPSERLDQPSKEAM